MKRIVSFVSIAAMAFWARAEWFMPNFKVADTNSHPVQTNEKTISVFTNAAVRSTSQNALKRSAVARQRLTAVDLDGLDHLLPAAPSTRISELARGLEYDWRKCFDFVRNHIAFTPYVGIMRGAERTLLDREGNDADQAFLLVALLRASGHSATVVYEPLVTNTNAVDSIVSGFRIPLRNIDGDTPYNAADWIGGMDSVGVSDYTVFSEIQERLGRTGIESVSYKTTEIVLPHYWVSLTADGVTRYLDPSFKPCRVSSARKALSDMGYNRDTLLASAGGILTSGLSVKNLSVNGLRSRLNAFYENLRTTWTNANASVEFFIGSREIIERTDGEFFHGGYFSDAPIDILAQPVSYCNDLRTKVELTCDGRSFYSFWLDEVGTRNLWVTTVSNGVYSARTSLNLDDACLATITTSSSGPLTFLGVDVQHKAPTTKEYALRRGSANAYSLVIGFNGDAKNGMRRFASDEVSRLKAQGVPNDSLRMLAATLYVQGQQWLSQCAMTQKLMNRIVDNMRVHEYYSIGISGQAGAPFVDMGNATGSSWKYGGYPSPYIFFSSALEHSVGEQLNGIGSVSTIKLLDLANRNGDTVYFVTSQNVHTVMSALINYSTSEKNDFIASANGGSRLLLPRNGRIVMNDWAGTGYVEHKFTANGMSVAMRISGGLNGGYATQNFCMNPGGTLLSTILNWCVNALSPDNPSGDPVSMPSGAFTDSVTDMTLIRKNSLVWGRSYDARNVNDDIGLGRGWSHVYDASVVETSDADAVLGASSVDAVIPTVVAIVVADDMMTGQNALPAEENARRWVIAAMAAQWWTEQMAGTAVAVKTGGGTFNFMKRPDGSYAAYPGVKAELAKTNGNYVLRERLGNTYRFNECKRLAEKESPSGNKVRLSYSYADDPSGRLIRVENDFDASFDVEWLNGRIARVIDSSGRSVSYSYGNDCLVAVNDVLGKAWTYSYDPSSRFMTSKANPKGEVLIGNEYNSLGQVVRQLAPNGEPWIFGYVLDVEAWDMDPRGNKLIRRFDAEGRTTYQRGRNGAGTTVSYDGHGHAILTINPLGRRSTAEYDVNDNLVLRTEGLGSRARNTRFGYDAENRLVAITNAIGAVNGYAYDSAGRIVKTFNPDGTFIQNVWNGNGTLAESLGYDACTNCLIRKVYTYNSYGLPTSCTIYGQGLPAGGLTTYTAYNSDGSVASTTDGNGNISTFTYDAAGQLLEERDPVGDKVTFTYDDARNLVSVRDKMNHVTTYEYTVSGKTKKTTYPDGSVVSCMYDALEDMRSMTDKYGNVTTFTRNELGLVTETESGGCAAYKAFDVMGNETNRVDASGVSIQTVYDEESRPIAVRDSSGAERTTAYDILGRPIRTTDALGKTYLKVYDDANQMVASVRPSGAVDAFGYDPLGFRNAFTNSEGSVYMTSYDALGRVLANTNALGRQTLRLEYDANGNILSAIDADGGVTTFTYDALNRLLSRTVGDQTDSFTYNANGGLLSACNATAEERLSYDVMNRLYSATVAINGLSVTTHWIYDLGGLPTNITYGVNGISLRREFDAKGRLVALDDGRSHRWTFAYDRSGRLLSSSSPDGRTSTFEYDSTGKLTAWRVPDVTARNISRNLNGIKIAERVTEGNTPEPIRDSSFENRFNAADQLLSSCVTRGMGVGEDLLFEYDLNGNCRRATSWSDGLVKGELSVSHDSSGAISSVSCNSSSFAFAYDALGTRVVSGGRVFIPNLADRCRRPLLEYDRNGVFVRAYIWIESKLLGYIDANNELTVAHTDEYGNVIALSRQDGTLVHTALYGPNGEDWGMMGTNPLPFAWLGGHAVEKMFADTFLGDIYMTRHRLYSTGVHRFLEPDPKGLAGGLNLYAYGGNNPVGYIDPSGLCAEEVDEPRKGTKDNPYVFKNSSVERPEGGLYKKGDWIMTSDGLIELPWDMFMDGEDYKHLGLLVDRTNSVSEGGEIREHNILSWLENKGYMGAVQDYYYSNEHANNKMMQNNVCQATAMIGEVALLIAPGGPDWGNKFTDALVTIYDVVSAANSISEYAGNMSRHFLPEGTHNRGSASGAQRRQREQQNAQGGKTRGMDQERQTQTTAYEEQQQAVKDLAAAAVVSMITDLQIPVETAQEVIHMLQGDEAMRMSSEAGAIDSLKIGGTANDK